MKLWLKDLLDTLKAVPVMYRAFRQERTMTGEKWYIMPKGGWACFHCGQVFTNTGAAAVHFGERPSMPVGCKVDVQEYRRMRDALAEAVKRLTRAGMPTTEDELHMSHVWGDVSGNGER